MWNLILEAANQTGSLSIGQPRFLFSFSPWPLLSYLPVDYNNPSGHHFLTGRITINTCAAAVWSFCALQAFSTSLQRVRNHLLLLLPSLCFKGLGVAKKRFTDQGGICLFQGMFWTRGAFEICKSFSFPLVLKASVCEHQVNGYVCARAVGSGNISETGSKWWNRARCQ